MTEFQADYKLTYLKVIWKNKLVDLRFPKYAEIETTNIPIGEDGDLLVHSVVKAYEKVQKGKQIYFKGNSMHLYMAPPLLNMFKSDTIIFDKIRLLRHMMVTIFMLSKNIISEQPAEATEEDLDREFLEQFERIQMQGTRKLQQTLERSIQSNKKLQEEMIESIRNNKDAIHDVERVILSSSGLTPKTNLQPCLRKAVKVELLSVGDLVHFQYAGKKRFGKIKEIEGNTYEIETSDGTFTMPAGSVFKDKTEIKQEPILEVKDDSSDDDLFEPAGAKQGAEPRSCGEEFLKTLHSKATEQILNGCHTFLYSVIDKEKYALEYRQFYRNIDNTHLNLQMQEFMENLFENTKAINIEDDYYLLLQPKAKHSWLSYLRLVTYEAFNLIKTFPAHLKNSCFEFLHLLIYDNTLAITMMNK